MRQISKLSARSGHSGRYKLQHQTNDRDLKRVKNNIIFKQLLLKKC